MESRDIIESFRALDRTMTSLEGKIDSLNTNFDRLQVGLDKNAAIVEEHLTRHRVESIPAEPAMKITINGKTMGVIGAGIVAAIAAFGNMMAWW